MMPIPNRQRLFVTSCLALVVTSLSFGIRAGILDQMGVEFHLDGSQLASITATAFWGFPLAVIFGGVVVDIIGMKNLLMIACVFHIAGIILTMYAGNFSNPYSALFISTLLIGLANGTVEAACNPLVATLFPENKTTKLNHFHLWFPGGIVIGTLISYFFSSQLNIGRTGQMAVMLVPAVLYGIMVMRVKFPVTERVASGVTTGQMYQALLNPLFLFMIICMFGTAITELFTNQWTDVLFKAVTNNALLILTFVATIQTLGRAFAAPIVHRLAPQGVLLISAILSALGIYLLIHLHGNSIFLAAVVFGLGVAFFWPCMIGFVAENLPRTGAVGLNLMGGAGMFAVSVYMIFMGSHYDKIMLQQLPSGASLDVYRSSAPGSEAANQYALARSAAGPEVLHETLIIPIILSIAFAFLFFYMRSKNKKTTAVAQPVANAYENL
jgi:MFS family permease